MVTRDSLTGQLTEVIEDMSARMWLRAPKEWSGFEHTMAEVRTLFLLSVGLKRISELASGLGGGLSAGMSMIGWLVNKGLVKRVKDT